jgi:phosphate transport system substrate-binding protein
LLDDSRPCVKHFDELRRFGYSGLDFYLEQWRNGMKRLLVLVALMVGITSHVHAMDITGAGASFPAPLYGKWAESYNKITDVRINYQSIGSSGGVNQIKAKTVDFGASDTPLSDADLNASALIQFPTVIGGVVPVVNIPGIAPGAMVLTAEVLANIYLGKITQWNDPVIQGLNTGLSLPAQKITVVRRADGSGTTAIFTEYLTKVNPDWAKQVGQGNTVNWPIGTGGKGNEGVSAFVSRLSGSIGYVEYAYAKQSNMAFIQLKNANGDTVAPNVDSFKAAAAGVDWTKSFAQSLTEQAAKGAWPITSATFILMHKNPADAKKAAATLAFFDWAYKSGGSEALALDYVPMPDNVIAAIRQAWTANIKDNQAKSIYAP